MAPNQQLVADDGYEVVLFPCEAMYISTARDPDEHDVLALDFLPRNTSGQTITAMPCYAPFSGTLVYIGADHNCILQSDNKVHFPDGTLKYGRVLVAHSFIAPVYGTHYNQGDLFYTTGDYGQSFGEHLHMEIASVDDTSVQYWNPGTGIGLYQAIHRWNGMFVNNTVLLRSKDYPWQTYEPSPTPSDLSHKYTKFPWAVLNRKIRERNVN